MRLKSKLPLLLSGLLYFFNLSAQQTIEGFEAPESIIKTRDIIFVSNIGGAQANPMAKDGNGFISLLSANGNIIQKKFQKTVLNGPKGLAVIGNTVYVADIDRIVGFNINSGDQEFELLIPEASFLNDLCSAGNNRLVVSESRNNKVYLINTSSKSYSFIGSIVGANGVTYDASTHQIFACGMGSQSAGPGKLYVKDLNSKDTVFNELPGSPTGVFDGLEFVDKDHLIVSDWISFSSDKGRLVVYDLKNHSNTVYSVNAGPADIFFDQATGTVYIPHLTKNQVQIVNLRTMKKD
jgi:hypothetical protein